SRLALLLRHPEEAPAKSSAAPCHCKRPARFRDHGGRRDTDHAELWYQRRPHLDHLYGAQSRQAAAPRRTRLSIRTRCPFAPADDASAPDPSAAHPAHAYRSAWWKYRHDQASAARREDQHHWQADGSQGRGAAYAATHASDQVPRIWRGLSEAAQSGAASDAPAARATGKARARHDRQAAWSEAADRHQSHCGPPPKAVPAAP